MAELLSLTPQTEPGEKGVDSAASYLRRRGRDFIIAFYGTLRAIKLYPLEHTAVQRSLVELSAIAREIVTRERDLEFRFSGEFIFINTTRLRLDLTNYGSFGYLLKICRESGIGVIRVHEDATERAWRVLLSLLESPMEGDPDERREHISGRLTEAGLTSLELGPPQDNPNDTQQAEQTKDAANRTYSRSVALTRDVINSVRMGRTPSIKKIKRVVQGIVDQILNEETSLIGLTTIRDYDEYTFTHSVNVCIFAVALGRRLGMSKLQLYELGMSALLHDIGKSRVPVGILNKSADLTEDEWLRIAAHPWLGVLVLFHLRGQQEQVPYRAMTVAYEHHMRTDLTAIPKWSARAFEHDEQDRRGRRWLRRCDFTPLVSDCSVPAGGSAAGHARQSTARHGRRRREGVHQPARHLPGRNAGRARYVRAGGRFRRKSGPRCSVPAHRQDRERRERQHGCSAAGS